MNKKVLMFTLMSLVLSVLVAPALAIGPQKARKNPNITIMPGEGVELLLPSGGFNEWMMDTEVWYMDFTHGLDASKAKIRNALPLTMDYVIDLMTDPEVALEAENKWGYVSYDVLVELFMMEGMTQEEAEAMAAMWPEGIYAKFVNVGK